jgi:hypothetical protein
LIKEEDYTDSILERVVTIDGDTEVEELFIQGKKVLKTIWENGQKISEQPIKE